MEINFKEIEELANRVFADIKSLPFVEREESFRQKVIKESGRFQDITMKQVREIDIYFYDKGRHDIRSFLNSCFLHLMYIGYIK